jgi:NAD(P)-dependent dehydrogenase (short-subunit alcohol dehydrogenase family)
MFIYIQAYAATPFRGGQRKARLHMAARDKQAPLSGRVAVVAGATRGAGRGIARALAEAGAIVYCTGRSVRGKPSPYNRPETIDETAEMIAARGGTAIPVRVDHTREGEVQALFARVDKDYGRLDVLVNSIAGETPLYGGWGSIEESDLTNGAEALCHGLLSHVITAKHAIPFMKRKKRGLIVEVTEHDLIFAGGNALSAIVKPALKVLAVNLSEELRSSKIAAVSITPGFLRSEAMLQGFGVTEANWRDGGKKDPNFLQSETPLFVGRAVAALAADPKVLAKSGDILSSWDLAREYGFTDEDGSVPDWGTHARDVVVPSMKWFRTGIERHVAWLDQLAARGRRYLSS